MRRAKVAVVATVLSAGVLAAPGLRAEGPELADGVPVADLGGDRVTGKLPPRMRAANGPSTVFVELARQAGVDAYAAERAGGRAKASGAARLARRAVAETAGAVLARLRATDPAAKMLYRTANAVAGLTVRADATAIRELALSDDVRALHPVVPKTRTNSGAAALTRTVETWQRTGRFGDGVRIGVIDDGIDYTHAQFGGPGTVEAYRAVDPDTVDPESFPTAKVVGGTDLVGDDYDGAGEGEVAVPDPDPNPLACGQHGTHVAGSAAGFGVDADGKTFRGDYATLTQDALGRMRIGPGMAPRAKLYAIKVFGCSGSTEVTAQALDRALDPNDDGDFGDRLDIVNLSLGSDFGAPDDPDALFVRKLARNGVLPVISAGNGGDRYDVAGSPGTTPEALTVASSRDSSVVRDAAEVTAPASSEGVRPGQYSQDYAGFDGFDRTRPVVALSSGNADGCKTFSTADSAAVKGKYAWLEWDDDDATRACGSFVRANNAEKAGAEGVVLSSTLAHFGAGLAGNEGIPMFQFTGPVTGQLRPALEAGTLEVRMAGELRTSLDTVDDSIVDTPSTFTSRGIRGPVVKPDLSAPGDTISSAAAGSGDGREVMSGTSMAAPVTAGVAALVRQAHPEWTVEQVKAALINTATHDVTNARGLRYAPQRVGAGRIDAEAAVGNDVLAYVAEDRGAVNVSFGVLEVVEPVTLSKTIRVVNTGEEPVTFTVGYTEATEMPGVQITVSDEVVTVAPGDTQQVGVVLAIADPAELRKTIDPTVDSVQAGLARQFVADVSGLVVFREGERELRVPVHAAPKPSSEIDVPPAVRFAQGRSEAVLTLDGRGIDQGAGSEAYRSLISVGQLHAYSGRLPSCGEHRDDACAVNETARGGDLRYVGALSTAPAAKATGDAAEAVLGFGIATWGTWANLGGNTVPFVDIDVDRDGEPDFETYVTRAADSDVLLVSTVDLHQPLPDGSFAEVDTQAVNGQLGDVDTNVFDSDVVVLPVRLAALGIDPEAASHRIDYMVGVVGFYTAVADEDGLVDAMTRPVTFDALAPAYWVSGDGDPALTHAARPGTALVVHRTGAPRPTDRQVGLLALVHHNERGQRAAVVRVGGPPPVEAAKPR